MRLLVVSSKNLGIVARGRRAWQDPQPGIAVSPLAVTVAGGWPRCSEEKSQERRQTCTLGGYIESQMVPVRPPSRSSMSSLYLFVLCPPYSGSTVLWRLISTSNKVSTLPDEGQFLPELQGVMRHDAWNPDHQLPWEGIREVWRSYWNLEQPVLIEKSPPNLMQVDAIRKHFVPAAFVLMVRDPYAHCEGLMRRNGWTAEASADFSIRRLRDQMENARRLPDAPRFTYEDLVRDPAAIVAKLEAAIPQLGELDPSAEFTTHANDTLEARPITDFNEVKVQRLEAADRAVIKARLAQDPEAMDFWGYHLEG